jgi:hypothetical protein
VRVMRIETVWVRGDTDEAGCIGEGDRELKTRD